MSIKTIKEGDRVRTIDRGEVFTVSKIVGRRVFAKEILLHTDIDCVELLSPQGNESTE